MPLRRVRPSRGAARAFVLALALAAVVAPAARADDASDALDELRLGYALKQKGDCRQAAPHFVRSVRLQATAKALLNLSDCEERLGDLVAARGHVLDGQRLAREHADAELTAVADEQLAGIDRRVAWLTVRLAPGSPAESVARCDEAPLDPAALGLPSPVNPGAHAVSVSAPGRAVRTFPVTLAEGQRAELEVHPGEPGRTLTLPVLVALGVAAVGLGLGVVAGVAAGSKHGTLESDCPGGACPEAERSDLDAFRALRAASTVGYAVAVAGVAGAALFYVAFPRFGASASASAWVGPGSIGVAGSF
jgi:hypothetical protein